MHTELQVHTSYINTEIRIHIYAAMHEYRDTDTYIISYIDRESDAYIDIWRDTYRDTEVCT